MQAVLGQRHQNRRITQHIVGLGAAQLFGLLMRLAVEVEDHRWAGGEGKAGAPAGRGYAVRIACGGGVLLRLDGAVFLAHIVAVPKVKTRRHGEPEMLHQGGFLRPHRRSGGARRKNFMHLAMRSGHGLGFESAEILLYVGAREQRYLPSTFRRQRRLRVETRFFKAGAVERHMAPGMADQQLQLVQLVTPDALRRPGKFFDRGKNVSAAQWYLCHVLRLLSVGSPI